MQVQKRINNRLPSPNALTKNTQELLPQLVAYGREMVRPEAGEMSPKPGNAGSIPATSTNFKTKTNAKYELLSV